MGLFTNSASLGHNSSFMFTYHSAKPIKLECIAEHMLREHMSAD